MQLKSLDQERQAELIAEAQGRELLEELSLQEIQDLWKAEHRRAACNFLLDMGNVGHYCYSDRSEIEVSATHWARAESGKHLVLSFEAKYSHNDLNLVMDPFAETHCVYYWVEPDGSLTWVSDSFKARVSTTPP